MPKAKAVGVGDPVLFEGLPHSVVAVVDGRVEFASKLRFTRQQLQAGGKEEAVTEPRFRTIANLADMRWSEEFNAWYLWGRLLGKGRGGGDFVNERAVVAELRDRGLLPARSTRQRGDAPAGGEHANLHASLFSKGLNWMQEMANVRRGDGLSTAAQAAVTDYAQRFARKLPDGYADPGADDSKEGAA